MSARGALRPAPRTSARCAPGSAPARRGRPSPRRPARAPPAGCRRSPGRSAPPAHVTPVAVRAARATASAGAQCERARGHRTRSRRSHLRSPGLRPISTAMSSASSRRSANAKRRRRRVVEPLGVVDHEQERRVASLRREEAQCRGADRKPIALGGWAHRQRPLERLPLAIGKLGDRPQERPAHVEQRAKRHRRLGLDAGDHGSRACRRRRAHRVLQERGLPDAGLARDDEHAATSHPSVREHPLQLCSLGVSANQHSASLRLARRRDPRAEKSRDVTRTQRPTGKRGRARVFPDARRSPPRHEGDLRQARPRSPTGRSRNSEGKGHHDLHRCQNLDVRRGARRDRRGRRAVGAGDLTDGTARNRPRRWWAEPHEDRASRRTCPTSITPSSGSPRGRLHPARPGSTGRTPGSAL